MGSVVADMGYVGLFTRGLPLRILMARTKTLSLDSVSHLCADRLAPHTSGWHPDWPAVGNLRCVQGLRWPVRAPYPTERSPGCASLHTELTAFCFAGPPPAPRSKRASCFGRIWRGASASGFFVQGRAPPRGTRHSPSPRWRVELFGMADRGRMDDFSFTTTTTIVFHRSNSFVLINHDHRGRPRSSRRRWGHTYGHQNDRRHAHHHGVTEKQHRQQAQK